MAPAADHDGVAGSGVDNIVAVAGKNHGRERDSIIDRDVVSAKLRIRMESN
jgi:hypothetical protein